MVSRVIIKYVKISKSLHEIRFKKENNLIDETGLMMSVRSQSFLLSSVKTLQPQRECLSFSVKNELVLVMGYIYHMDLYVLLQTLSFLILTCSSLLFSFSVSIIPVVKLRGLVLHLK